MALFGWFWFSGDIYASAWNVSGKSDASAVMATLTFTLWAFIGVESASVSAGVVENPSRNVPIATVGGVALASFAYILSSSVIMTMLPYIYSMIAIKVLGYRQMSNSQYTFFVGAGLVGAIYCMVALIGSDGEQTRWSLVFVISTIVFFSASVTRKRDIEEKHLHPGGRAPYWVRYPALGVTIVALVAMFWLSIGEKNKGDLRTRSPQSTEISQPVGATGAQEMP